MKDLEKVVNSKEYQSLLDLEESIRIALVTPNCGHLIAGAINRIDTVRSLHKIDAPNVTNFQRKKIIETLTGHPDGSIGGY